MSTCIYFFKKYYKSDITEDELKDIVNLDLSEKYIKFLPSGVFDKCVNLHTLNLYKNKLTVLDPSTFVNNINLHALNLSNNNLTVLDPNTFVNNLNLHTLLLFKNNLTVLDPSIFVNNVNLHTLYLFNNELTVLDPSTFVNNVNLHTLDLSFNKLSVLNKNTFVKCINLHTLYLYYNDLTEIDPNTFVNNVNLHTLSLTNNKLTVLDLNTFVNNVNLRALHLSHNRLTALDPSTFVNNVNLDTLNLSDNNLSSLPLEIINLRNLEHFYYDNNPIENIHPVLMRFLDNMRNRVTATNRGIYSDTQSVHSGAIQESVRNSIIAILKDKKSESTDTVITTVSAKLKEDIIKDDILTATTKSLILEYIEDKTTHSSLFITFEDLFIRVWNRIKEHASAIELKKILDQEMKEAECKCFTGRLSRLVNVLGGGFFDDVKITVSSSDQIGNVILAIKEKLEKEGNYTPEKHREIAVKELTERGYESEVIKVWTDEI